MFSKWLTLLNSMATRRPGPSKENGDDDPTPPAKRVKTEKSPSVKMVDMLQSWAKEFGCSINDMMFAQIMDGRDTLRDLRNEFIFPKMQELPNGESFIIKWLICLRMLQS